MIPKIIHYCWFGRNPLPPLALKCIESWKKFLPDYEIKEWNEDNFDVNMISYTAEAYHAKKYAFVSDYARFWILYNYGGLYFDTDVEVIKPMEDIIDRGPFMGCEKDASDTSVASVAPGLGLGVNPGLGLYKEMLDLYATLHFQNSDGSYNQKTIVSYTTEKLCEHGLKNTNQIQECVGVWIYPKDYFCPMLANGEINIVNETCTIHHYLASWLTPEEKYAINWIKGHHWLKPVSIRTYCGYLIAAYKYRGLNGIINKISVTLRKK